MKTTHLTLESLENRLLLSANALTQARYDLETSSNDDLSSEITTIIIGDAHPAQIRFTEPDGTKVTIKHKGGFASIAFIGNNLVADSNGKKIDLVGAATIDTIALSNTNSSSQLTIKASNGTDNSLSLNAITGSGLLKKLSAPRVNLVGDGLTITNGFISQTILSDLSNGADISFTGLNLNAGLKLQLNNLDDGSDIISDTAFKQVKINQMGDGAFTAPSIDKLLVSNDLGANLTLTGPFDEKDDTLKKAKIQGNLTGTSSITGNVGQISLDLLLGKLNITGTAKQITLDSPIAITSTLGDGAGQLALGSEAKLKTPTEKISLDGETVYAAPEHLYGLEELRRYTTNDSTWTYNITEDGLPGTFSKTTTVDEVQTAGDNISYTVSFVGDNIDQHQQWDLSLSGNSLTQWSQATTLGDFEINIQDLAITYPYLLMGTEINDEGTFTGTFVIDAGGYGDFPGTFTGTIDSTFELTNHEYLTTSLGTLLTARCEVTLEIEGVITISDGDETSESTYEAEQTQVFWSRPDIGILQMTDTQQATLTMGSLGNSSYRSSTTQTLNAYDLSE